MAPGEQSHPHVEVSEDMNPTVHLAGSKEGSPCCGRTWEDAICASLMHQPQTESRTLSFAPVLGKKEGLEWWPSKEGLLHILWNPTAEVHQQVPQQLYLG